MHRLHQSRSHTPEPETGRVRLGIVRRRRGWSERLRLCPGSAPSAAAKTCIPDRRRPLRDGCGPSHRIALHCTYMYTCESFAVGLDLASSAEGQARCERSCTASEVPDAQATSFSHKARTNDKGGLVTAPSTRAVLPCLYITFCFSRDPSGLYLALSSPRQQWHICSELLSRVRRGWLQPPHETAVLVIVVSATSHRGRESDRNRGDKPWPTRPQS